MIKNKIVAAYEELAENYDALIDHKPHNAYYDRPNMLNLIGEPKEKTILDAACGPGKYAQILLERGARVTGFDISPKMVAKAKKRNNLNGDFFVHDLVKPMTMFDKALFDIILCALAMHYIENWNQTIQEFCRVLKPGGILVLSVEHPFFEYQYFNSNKYFEIEAVKATWSGFGKDVEVHSFRRSLQECLQPLTANGFYIDSLVEPKPVPEFEKLDPKHFKELNEFPAFMCIRAIKK